MSKARPLLPVGLDCCVSYDEPMILVLSGTLSTTVKNLVQLNRRENNLNTLAESILVVKIILTNRKIIVLTTSADSANTTMCFCIDFSHVVELANKSKLFINTTSLTLFELNSAGRCLKGTTKYTGEFDVHIKIRGMTDELYRLFEGVKSSYKTNEFLKLISPDLLKLFWGATNTTTWVCRITRLRCELVRLCFINEGIIIVASSPDGGYVSDVLHLSRMLFAFKRMHGSVERDLELFYVKSNKHVESILLRFFNEHDYNVSAEACSARLFLAQKTRKFTEHITSLWVNGKLSSYHYLSYLNTIGGRSRNDFTTYPVFPWTLCDQFLEPQKMADMIRSASLAENDAGKTPTIKFHPEIRDLAKPMGAQDATHLKELLEKQKHLSEASYLYGSHYSNASYVTHLMIRSVYESNMLIHEGHLDLASRSFLDIRLAWKRAMKENNCFMELVPEMYENDWEVLSSERAGMEDLSSVIPNLAVYCHSPFTHCMCAPEKCSCNPAWLNNDSLWFLFVHRLALESPPVSANLHNWIDLVFGCKQKGEASVKDNNVFHPAAYLASTLGQHLVPGAVGNIKEEFDEALVTQALEFGQCPLQIFSTPHPARQNNGAIWEETEFTPQAIWTKYLGFCNGTSQPALETCSWIEFLVKHPRSFPPVARIPSVLYCSTKDHVIIRYKESDPRIWSGLPSTPCLTNVICEGSASSKSSTTPQLRVLEDRQREVAHKDLICRFTQKGRYKVFTCLGSADVYETNVSHKITTAAWDAHRHLYLGTREGEIIVGGVGSHYLSDEEAFAPVPAVLNAKRVVHRGSISALRCRHDRLVSGCVRETVCVWDVTTTKEPIIQAEGWHNSRITALDIVDSVIVYSTDRSGVFAIHDLRLPPWRSEVFPPQKFESDWFVSSITRPSPTSTVLQLILSDSLEDGLTNKAVLNMDLNTCKSSAPLLFGTKSHVCVNGSKLKGVSLSPTPCGPLSLEGSDTLLAIREKDLACYKDSKIIKTWELPVPGNSITSLHAFPILTDSTDESGCSILTPFIRAYSSSYDHTTIIC